MNFEAVEFDHIVIGGGFFGCSLAAHLKEPTNRVLLIEQCSLLMSRASFKNQARVHGGYHYARSFLTASRSRHNIPRFLKDFGGAIERDFTNYYGVARNLSHISAGQFLTFCGRIEAPIRPVHGENRNLFNMDLLEEVYETEEYVFDAVKLKDIIKRVMAKKRISIIYSSQCENVSPTVGGLVLNISDSSNSAKTITAGEVWVCTYSATNELLQRSNLKPLGLRQEFTEMALIEVPLPLKDVGITIIDGPFFSLMPFPPKNAHTLSHVRYTPRYSWEEPDEKRDPKRVEAVLTASSVWQMQRDAARFVPLLSGLKHLDSIWETKTTLIRSETNDSRPILFQPNYGMAGLHLILGGKIDNVYDILDEVESYLKSEAA